MALTVVLDTNLWVSACARHTGKPARIVELAEEGEVRILTSKAIWDELTGVLHGPSLRNVHGLSDAELTGWLQAMRRLAQWTPGDLTVDAVPDDPDDNVVVACAVEGGADYIVSGDHHLLALKSYSGIPIISAARFLEIRQRRST